MTETNGETQWVIHTKNVHKKHKNTQTNTHTYERFFYTKYTQSMYLFNDQVLGIIFRQYSKINLITQIIDINEHNIFYQSFLNRRVIIY